MTRKIVVFADGLFKKENYDNPKIQEIFKNVEKYDAKVEVVEDDTLTNFLKEGEPFSKAMIAVEKNGPEYFEQTQRVIDSVKDAEIALFHFNPCSTKQIAAGNNLKLVGSLRSGAENINVNACKEKGIHVCTTPGRVSEAVADYTVGMMLALNRDIPMRNMSLPDVDWVNTEVLLADKGILMKDATIGIVGFGIIGKKVTRRIQAFGSKVIAYDPYCSEEVAKEYGVELVELNTLMKESDFVCVHARLLESTKGIIGKEQIALMKNSAYFINTARAGLVDETALTEALVNNKIRGAALDVFADEPLPKDSKLLQAKRVILTPHCAGAAGDGTVTSIEIMFDEVERYLKGEKLLNELK